MKTTVEIPDSLTDEARAVALREKTTLRELIETGLRLVLRERNRPRAATTMIPRSRLERGC